ncbi:MAG: bifunctional phosphopantothenoylcysteine decarboxylase/phosphopantothenate--cysteine ligase CoaBC [Gammaproteobacteria bacterium]|nr:bifunctional phosphopantothenoylcysteine decarboxylase/phosphopantothenate--cysteine ligase CoaBC [Gammaproteobacteria bacterium]
MSILENKKIILGVCGGIAAYKSAELVRLLVKQQAQVQVVMTLSSQEFIGPQTFQALSGRVVRTQTFDLEAEAGMGHIELARWADLILIAPATANTVAKIAHGNADDLLTTLCLATSAPLFIAPAMNQQMWCNKATQNNVEILLQRQVTFSGPAEGVQACGDTGQGRMEEPVDILSDTIALFESRLNLYQAEEQPLKGRQILITAGPTIEDIDPVRYMSNRSSGKMGYAIAQAALDAGASVKLVSGPTALNAPVGAELIKTRNALQMHSAVFKQIESTDIFIATAAVADYRPIKKCSQKIKKNAETLTIEMTKNPDILSDVAALSNKPICIGFAAETNDVKSYAQEKLERKNLDMVAANKVGEQEGFEGDNNELLLLWQQQTGNKSEISSKQLPYGSKKQLARQLIDEIVLLYT